MSPHLPPLDRPQGVPEAFESPRDRALYRRVAHRQGVELYRAEIVHHAFAPHAHDAFGIGAVEWGIERFRYQGSDHLAGPGSVVLMDDDELHTGRADTEQGWRYRMIYLQGEVLAEVGGRPLARFAQATVDDPVQGRQITTLLDALWDKADNPLAFDSLLATLVDAVLARYTVNARTVPTTGLAPRVLADVRDYIEAHLDESIRLDALAAVAGLSPFHFLRRFKAATRHTPQVFVQARRGARAKALLAQGLPAAEVAAAVGLVDQPHLNRLLRKQFGITPGVYQRQLGV